MPMYTNMYEDHYVLLANLRIPRPCINSIQIMRHTDYMEYITICNIHMPTNQVSHIQPTAELELFAHCIAHDKSCFANSTLLQFII